MTKMTASKIAVAAMAAAMVSTASADVISETNGSLIEWGFAGTGAVTQGEATLFPSTISVAGAAGVITDVNVTLHMGVGHTFSDDLEIGLRSADGTVIMLMQDVGGGTDLTGDLTFDASAAGVITDTYAGTGTFMASVDGTGTFDSTGPAATASGLAAFNGEGANGDWDLFVYDDAGGDTGTFLGWTLDITTTPAPASALLLGLGGVAIRRRR